MQRARIIPILTVDNGKLVKTVKFKKPNYIGDPINAIKIFNDKMIDEIVILDITASKQGRKPNTDLIYEMASECFSPLGYGGGITSFEEAKKVFDQGVEKVIINSAIAGNASLLQEIADAYGSQSVVVSLDVKKPLFGGMRPCFRSASDVIKEDIVAFAQRMESAGAGELIVHNTDRDGTFSGLDRELTKSVASAVGIPVIACGGAHSVEDMNETISATGASAAAAGSIFVYKDRNPKSILISYPTPEDIISR
ncbi:AglZ/HisF2 family acetamidino modification protein [Sanyastnella coralliicola]|uniref:AglZ/HisF2 family acetamidino modification protein n=1 Tax=Sanyastnella coralliicola TaxID=3069118 RepID=UPI0027BB1DCF|nr:AglZ/HisF2 family acetamidino modification protein [Longitalea sp. SCSIO 12813]